MNDLLRRQRQLRGWSLERVADLIRAMGGGADSKMVGKWERGVNVPRPYHQEILCKLYGCNAVELGFVADLPTHEGQHLLTMPRQELAWFDGDLAVLLSNQRRSFDALLDHIEHIIEEAVRGFEMVQKNREGLLLSRRQVFSLLLGSPIAALGLSHSSSIRSKEEVLAQCVVTIPLCWRLYFAGGLAEVKQVLPDYLSQLAVLSEEPRYHQVAAGFASQGHQLAYLLALQAQNFGTAEQHIQLALQFAQRAESRDLQVASLVRKGNLFHTRGWRIQTVQAYEEAMRASNQMVSPLLRGQMYAGAAEAYAGLDNEQAQRFMGQAHHVFPERPEEDVHFTYTHFNHFTLTNFEGLMHLRRGQAQQAWETFAQVDKAVPTALVPQRVELSSRQLAVAFALGELEQCRAYLIKAVTAAIQLGSDLRYSEVCEVYGRMQEKWGNEQQVKELAELFQR
jgi:transcriptional regulator with XRE-family HTH domain